MDQELPPGVHAFRPIDDPLANWPKTGSQIKRSARVWAALDLLLTCETITEARDRTNERLAAAGA